MLRLLAIRPAALRFPSLGGTVRCAACSRRGSAAQTPTVSGSVVSANPLRLPSRRRRRDLPGSRETLAHMPCSQTPASPHTPTSLACAMVPSVKCRTSALASVSISRLHHTACALPVKLRGYGRPQTRASLGSGWRRPWPGGILTHGVSTRGFQDLNLASCSSSSGLFPAHAFADSQTTAPSTQAGNPIPTCSGSESAFADSPSNGTQHPSRQTRSPRAPGPRVCICRLTKQRHPAPKPANPIPRAPALERS